MTPALDVRGLSVDIAVLPEAADRLTTELAERGWRIAG